MTFDPSFCFKDTRAERDLWFPYCTQHTATRGFWNISGDPAVPRKYGQNPGPSGL